MPKVSDYELAHLDDEKFEIKKPKRTKQVREKKYTEKKDYRANWKVQQKVEENLKQSDDFESE